MWRQRLNREVELKLELPRQAAKAFEHLPLLPGESDVAELRATYFDTPDRLLRTHGLSLRIRQSGKERTQTVKADDGQGGGGLFARAEWEIPVMGDRPVIDSRTPLAAALGEAAESIEPAFHVDVKRRIWLLSEGAATIELVLDKGAVRADDRQAPLCEIEMELKEGEPSALFSFARRIEALAPVRLGVMAKAERGYQLTEAVQQAYKAEPVSLDPDIRTGQAFQAIARACVRHYRLNEALLLDHYDPKALHQARVAIRRLRSAFSIFKPILIQQDVARFQTELRWLAAVLGEGRNLDVLIERTDAGTLHDQIQAARVKAQAEIGAALESARVRSLLIDLVEWLALGMGAADAERQCLRNEPARSFAARRLQHFHRRVVKGGRNMAKLEDDARHEVRKDAKKLRYASEFFAALFAENKKRQRRRTRFIDALEGLQDDLGQLNDLASAPHILARHGLVDDDGMFSDGGKRKKKLLAAAEKAHDALTDTPCFWR